MLPEHLCTDTTSRGHVRSPAGPRRCSPSLAPKQTGSSRQWSAEAPSPGLPGPSAAALCFLVAGEDLRAPGERSSQLPMSYTLFGGPELEALNWPSHLPQTSPELGSPTRERAEDCPA